MQEHFQMPVRLKVGPSLLWAAIYVAIATGFPAITLIFGGLPFVLWQRFPDSAPFVFIAYFGCAALLAFACMLLWRLLFRDGVGLELSKGHLVYLSPFLWRVPIDGIDDIECDPKSSRVLVVRLRRGTRKRLPLQILEGDREQILHTIKVALNVK